MYGIVYLAENLSNGKRYVGQTTSTLERRRYSHKEQSKIPKTYFHSAIAKYGMSNFRWTVLEEAEDQSSLDNKECAWIAKFCSNDREKGYNLKEGGSGGGHHSEESKRKMSISHLGMKASEEAKQKMSRAHKGRHYNIGNTHRKGKKASAEAKKKLSEFRKTFRYTEEQKRMLSEAHKRQWAKRRETNNEKKLS